MTSQNTTDSAINMTDITLADIVTQQAIDLIKNKIITEIDNKSIDTQLLMSLLIVAMETIEQTPIKGTSQKDIVKEVLIDVIKLPQTTVPNKEQVILFIQNDLDIVIDLLVDSSKGKFNINKTQKQTFSLLKYLFSCLKNK
jgi:hypothetical protein